MSSWTIVTSPVDDLLVCTDGSAITGIEFEPHRPATGGAGRHAPAAGRRAHPARGVLRR